MLLHIIKGPTCYEDLRKVNGRIHDTYKEACDALGLLDDDGEWGNALMEASGWAIGNGLRNMFCEMLLFCEVKDPNDLWRQHWPSLSDDLLIRFRRETRDNQLHLSENELKNLALAEIESILAKNGRSLSEFLTIPFNNENISDSNANRFLRDELSYDVESLGNEFEEMHASLNEEQKIIFDEIIKASCNKKGGLYFVNGSGGTGKTFMWKTKCHITLHLAQIKVGP